MNSVPTLDWRPHPEARRQLDSFVSEFLGRCPQARELASRMSKETGTRLFDWIDFIEVPRAPALRERLEAVGFAPDPRAGAEAHGLSPSRFSGIIRCGAFV